MEQELWIEQLDVDGSQRCSLRRCCECNHLRLCSLAVPELRLHGSLFTPRVVKVLLALGLSTGWQAYHTWRKYKAAPRETIAEVTVQAAARERPVKGFKESAVDMKELFQLQVVKTMYISTWNEQVKAEAIAFWQRRGISFNEVTDNHFEGRRGSVWGNLTSFDMSRLITNLRLTVSPTKPYEVFCCLDIDTRFQVVTEWNKEYWQLELDTFESHLLCGDQKEGEWDQLRKESRALDYLWVLSLGWIRRKMPHKP